MKLTKEIANKVYDILVDTAGAPENMRANFIYLQSTSEIGEYRFQGYLGFGGKFWNNYYHFDKKFDFSVSCYREDENEERRHMINITNEKLKQLANEISQSHSS